MPPSLPSPTGKSAVLLGATGLVGRALLRLLLADDRYTRIIAPVRRTLETAAHPKLQAPVTDYARLTDHPEWFAADDIFCCLGTTMKKAGTQEAFRRVDLGYPVLSARLAKESGASAFHVISAIGARPRAKAFYSRVKGEMETELRRIGLPSLHIYRPSLLLGEREESRLGEDAAAAVYRALPFLFTGPLRKYKPIPADTVARAMMQGARDTAAGNSTPGPYVRVHESEELFHMAKRLR